MNLYNLVTFFQGFLQLHATPCSLNGCFTVRMGSDDMYRHRKTQFALGVTGKNRVEQLSRWRHLAIDQTTIGGDFVKVFGDDAWT